MAAKVIAAAAPLPVAVVCEDDAVARFAENLGASVIWAPAAGLSGAVAAGVDELGRRGYDVVTVAHGDLPLAWDLPSFGRDVDEGGGTEVALVPDRHLDGTNVATIPSRSGFRFAYGPGSFERHRAEAVRVGLSCRIIHDARLAIDVDLPDDLLLVQVRG
jgi:2-phospho-L-lactate guanylyltransferase